MELISHSMTPKYDTTFVSNRAARVAEEISRSKGLTIAKEVKAERMYQKAKSNPTREQTKKEVQQICYALLDKHKGGGISGHSMFLYELNKNNITIERMKNKQGKVYGLRFSYCGQTFKASEIGREFGYRSLQKNFETPNKTETKQAMTKAPTIEHGPVKNKTQPDIGYQLVPPSRSYIPPFFFGGRSFCYLSTCEHVTVLCKEEQFFTRHLPNRLGILESSIQITFR